MVQQGRLLAAALGDLPQCCSVKRPRPPGIEIPGYLRSPLPGASKEVPDGTAAGSPGFQSRAAEAADAPGKDDARLSEPYFRKPGPRLAGDRLDEISGPGAYLPEKPCPPARAEARAGSGVHRVWCSGPPFPLALMPRRPPTALPAAWRGGCALPCAAGR